MRVDGHIPTHWSFAEAFNHAAKAEMAAVVATPDAVFRTGHQAIGELCHVCSIRFGSRVIRFDGREFLVCPTFDRISKGRCSVDPAVSSVGRIKPIQFPFKGLHLVSENVVRPPNASAVVELDPSGQARAPIHFDASLGTPPCIGG